MPTLSIRAVQSRTKLFTSLGRTAEETLASLAARLNPTEEYDLFFACEGLAPELVLGVKLTLDDFGYKTLFEWPLEPPSRRMQITPERASSLREKLDHSRSFLFVTTAARTECSWLPWAFGYCEGQHGRVAVLPMTPSSADIYRGEDYLNIYPYVASYSLKNHKEILVVMHGAQIYCTFDNWLNGTENPDGL